MAGKPNDDIDIHKIKEKVFSHLTSSQDEELIEEFIRECVTENLSNGRIRKYLLQYKRIANKFDFQFSGASEEDIKDLFIEVRNDSEWKDSTKRDYYIGVRKLYTALSDEHEGHGDFPDKVDWIPTSEGSDRKDPDEILTQEDIKDMAEATWNRRDRAFVLALYESGCRIGEFRPLKMRHIELDKHGAKLSVDGKTGSRRIRIYKSVPAIKEWLENHPASDNPDAYVWTGRMTPSNPEFENKPLHYHTVNRRLKKIANQAGIDKDVNPHAFRHARATHLATELKEAQMRKYFGWTPGSDVPSRYVHLSGRDIDNAILELNGVKNPEEDSTEMDRVKCPDCGERVSPAQQFCGQCGVSLAEAEEEKELEDVMIKFMEKITDEDPKMKQKFREVVQEEDVEELF
jgi:integrase/recombinase XerD